MEFVFAGFLRLIALKQNNSAALVTCREVVARLIEFDGGDDISLCDVFYVALVAEASVDYR